MSPPPGPRAGGGSHPAVSADHITAGGDVIINVTVPTAAEVPSSKPSHAGWLARSRAVRPLARLLGTVAVLFAGILLVYKLHPAPDVAVAPSVTQTLLLSLVGGVFLTTPLELLSRYRSRRAGSSPGNE